MKNFSDTNRNQTCKLPARRTVFQPNAPRYTECNLEPFFPHCTLCTMNTTLATNVTYEDPPCCSHVSEHHRHQSTWQMFHLTSLPLHLAGAAASLAPWSTPTYIFLKENFEYNNRQQSALHFNTTVSNIAKIFCSVLWRLSKEQKWSNVNVWILKDVVMWGMEKIPCRPVCAWYCYGM